MAGDIFTSIYSNLSASMGFEWIAFGLLFMAFFIVLLTLLELDVLLALSVTSLPLLLYSMYNLITLGSWGISAVIVALGLIFGLSIYRIFDK